VDKLLESIRGGESRGMSSTAVAMVSPYTITVVVPTRNEAQNIEKLLSGLKEACPNCEMLVVDDSDDNTSALALSFGARVVKGKRKGLGQAILDGIQASKGDIVVVMDADLSHSPKDVPKLLHPILRQGYDMTIGSRYCPGGKVVGWELSRRIVSRVACLLALPVTTIKDSTSGFFAFRKEIIKGIELKGTSWKIMLEIWAKAHPVAVKEVPIVFSVRTAGKSKFNREQMRAYLRHLWLLCLFKYQRFIKFCVVGSTGAAITFFLTWLFTDVFGLFYLLSLVFAVGVATITNYTFNALWTFKVEAKPDSPDYEWNAFYQGNPIQRWWKQGIAKAIWKMLPREGKVLDVGAGSSPNCSYFKDVTVMDADAGKLATLKAKMPHISTIVGSACKLEFPDASFDSVTCIEVLEHLPSPKRAVEEIARVLKIGGKAVIATPDYSKRQWLLAEKFTSYRNGHVSRFTKNDLEMLCRRYKLVPRDHQYICGCDLCELFEKVK